MDIARIQPMLCRLPNLGLAWLYDNETLQTLDQWKGWAQHPEAMYRAGNKKYGSSRPLKKARIGLPTIQNLVHPPVRKG